MTTITRDATDQQALRRLRWIGLSAGLATIIATLAGVVLTISDPASGSRLEGVLGFTAAVAGLSVAVLAITAAIYAQVKDLWRFAPASIRSIVWTLVALALLVTIVNQVTQAVSFLD